LSIIKNKFIFNYGVAERWVCLNLFFLRIKKNNNPSDNADMSNEKATIIVLALSLWLNKSNGL